MPNRTIRDWTDSWTIQELSSDEERFLIRLMMKADDFGRFHANTNALKSFLFPLLPDVSTEQVKQWRDKCVAIDLISLYLGKNGKEFLLINNFGQRLRQMKTQFPAPCGHKACTLAPSCKQGGGNLSADCQRVDDNLSVEEKRREEKRSEGKGDAQERESTPPNFSITEIPSEAEVIEHAAMQGISAESAKRFWSWSEGNNAWLDKFGNLKKWRINLKRWAEDDKSKNSNGKRNFNGNKIDRNQGTTNAGKASQYAGVGKVVSSQSVQ